MKLMKLNIYILITCQHYKWTNTIKLSTVIASVTTVTMTMLQDKLLAKMDNEEEEKMPYSADDQVFGHDSYSVTNNFRIWEPDIVHRRMVCNWSGKQIIWKVHFTFFNWSALFDGNK